ncbi:hypothetical protein D3C72_1929730 [compost metagenome]
MSALLPSVIDLVEARRRTLDPAFQGERVLRFDELGDEASLVFGIRDGEVERHLEVEPVGGGGRAIPCP